jgi:hypothetical protein
MSAQPIVVMKISRSKSVCYPFSDKHLRRHSEKMVDGSYRIVEFTDQLAKIHTARRLRQEAAASMSSRMSSDDSDVSNMSLTESMSSSSFGVVEDESRSNVLSAKRKSLPNLRPLDVPIPQDEVKKSWFFN